MGGAYEIRGMEGMEEEEDGAITCKAYSVVSSEATGSERMEAYGCAFEGVYGYRRRHRVG
jgi:hypothetical protein